MKSIQELSKGTHTNSKGWKKKQHKKLKQLCIAMAEIIMKKEAEEQEYKNAAEWRDIRDNIKNNFDA